ncbi:hypothetical protein ES703_68730 [subsurface metagenome]
MNTKIQKVVLIVLFALPFVGNVFVTDANAQSCIPAPANMVGWWPGDGNADDIVGGNHGTLMGGAGFATGMVDQAFSFDGMDDFVSIADAPSLDLTTAITLDAWIRTTKSNAYQCIVGKFSGNALPYAPGEDAQRSYMLYVHSSNSLAMIISTNGGQRPGDHAYVIGTIVPENTWVHVAGTYDGSSINIYLNGNPAGSVSYNQPAFVSTAPVRIGTYVQPGYSQSMLSFGGNIDEVEIFNRALSASEIDSIYQAGSAGKCKVLSVEIDIKPGSYPNSINPNAGGVIPVAILTTADFDASTVDPETVALEGAGARSKGKSGRYGSMEDVDGDGDLDLVVQIENVIEWDPDATEATLTGETYDGIAIQGTDSVNIVPLE